MKRYKHFLAILVALASVVTVIVGLFISHPVIAQTGTTLVLVAKWDDGTAVAGTVTLVQNILNQPDTLLVVKTLSNGRARVVMSLAPNAFYTVTVGCHGDSTCADGAQLTSFPVFTGILDPANLSRAQATLVFRKADQFLASATVTVSMAF